MKSTHRNVLQVIPRQLCDNAGFDATDVLNKLRQKHASGWFFKLYYYIELSVYICTVVKHQAICFLTDF